MPNGKMEEKNTIGRLNYLVSCLKSKIFFKGVFK